MPDLFEVNAAYRAALQAREAAAVAELTRAYGLAWQALSAQVEALTEALAGEGEPSPGALFRLERYHQLQSQLADVMNALAPAVEGRILAEQAAAIRLGQDAALAQIRALLGDEAADALQLTRLPDAQLKQLLGFLAPGSPLRDAVAGLGEQASQDVRDGLVKGMTLGLGARQIAASVRDSFGGNLTSALRYSRTATLYSYRGAALEHFRAHDDVIAGWVWTAALGPRTCLACLNLHGTFFPLSEPMHSHWSCRCSAAPATRGSRVAFERGGEWFERQDEATQRAILGPARFAAWQGGKVTLRDFLGQRDDPTLGSVYQERSLTDLVGAKQASRYRTAAVSSAGQPPIRGGSGGGKSQHPTDLLIRELVDTKRSASTAEIQAILDRMTQVPFSRRAISVPKGLRGESYLGRRLGAQEESLFVHLVRRVKLDQQWAEGTTEQDYVADLQAAILSPAAQLVIYRDRGGTIAGVVAPNMVPATRLGPAPLPLIYVVYSADWGRLISGYQASVDQIRIPGDALWLK